MIVRRKTSPYCLSWLGLALIALCSVSLLTRAAESPSNTGAGLSRAGTAGLPASLLVHPELKTLDSEVRKLWQAQGVSSDYAIRATLQEESIATIKERISHAALKGVNVEKADNGAIRVSSGKAGDLERLRSLVLRRGGVGFHIVAKSEEVTAALASIEASPKFSRSLLPLLDVKKEKDSQRISFPAQRLDSVRAALEELDGAGGVLPQGEKMALASPHKDGDEWQLRLIAQDSGMNVITVEKASAQKEDDNPGHARINFEFSPEDAERFGRLTEANINRGLAILTDEVIQSAPVIRDRITKSGQITGNFTMDEATDLAAVIRAKPLPAALIEDKAQ